MRCTSCGRERERRLACESRAPPGAEDVSQRMVGVMRVVDGTLHLEAVPQWAMRISNKGRETLRGVNEDLFGDAKQFHREFIVVCHNGRRIGRGEAVRRLHGHTRRKGHRPPLV